MEIDYSWIYLLVFLAFPMMSIIPRILRARKNAGNNKTGNGFDPQRQQQQRNEQSASSTYRAQGVKASDRINGNRPNTTQNPYDATPPPQNRPKKPLTKNMTVLGEIYGGARTFEIIQKRTGMAADDLDGILESLEKKQFIRVNQKQGMFGTKIEIHPTDKGFKEYYSQDNERYR